MNNSLTPLDEKLRELAITDWSAFVDLIGQDAIDSAKICLLRTDKRSIRFIANKLKTNRGKVHRTCKKCPANRDK